MQAVLADFRLGFGLKYDGGQLFMITNENKLTNSISTRHITRTKKPQQLWFQYLSSLIHNSHIESFQTEQFRFGGECGDSAYKKHGNALCRHAPHDVKSRIPAHSPSDVNGKVYRRKVHSLYG